MKLSETGRIVRAYVQALKAGGACPFVPALEALANFLNGQTKMTMEHLRNRIRDAPLNVARTSADGPDSCKASAVQLKALNSVLVAGRARNAQIADIELLIELLQTDSVYDLDMLDFLKQLARPLQEPRIEHFIERLNSQIGGDAFESTFEELSSSDLKREAVVEIAVGVYGGVPKKTSRKAALSFIRKPHDARMSAKRGISAMGGRSAA
jgi:hypothetical protein